MKLSHLSIGEIRGALRDGVLLLKLDPFVLRLCSDVPNLADNLQFLYADFSLGSTDDFADFHVEIYREPGLRKWFRPLARFFFDGKPSFIPLPINQAPAMLEWGLNWCVAAHAHQYLIIHAAVVEKNGVIVLMPAPPGSGKSTLCASLVLSGWRLLSDELALMDIASGLVCGMARPISLKNQSIQLIKQFAPSCDITEPMFGTTKGTVALLKPPKQSVDNRGDLKRPKLVVFPQYISGAEATLEPKSKASIFMLLAEQSFNFDVLGVEGFQALSDFVDDADCFHFSYSALSDALSTFEKLVERYQ